MKKSLLYVFVMTLLVVASCNQKKNKQTKLPRTVLR